MSKLILFVGVILVMALAIGCNKDCSNVVQQNIENITGPTVGNSNSEIKLTISYTSGDCDKSPRFEELQNGLTKSVKIFEQTESCVCTLKLNTKTGEFKFTPSSSGKHVIIFYNRDGSSISHTVQVQ